MGSFTDFELSEETLKGLEESGYKIPTEIQTKAIPSALAGHDILGAARTGSGKTLAFVIPILEILHKEKWSDMWGLGALVITPTRELAFQIAQVFTEVGRHHKLAVGLVIGGKDLAIERTVMKSYSIVICTPGRILDHMDKNHLFDVSSLKIVVIDEADRILDMSFAKDMESIVNHLPSERQTLLFSATQTRSVKDLSRLSLVDPMSISSEEQAEGLTHFYTVMKEEEKIQFLWSFIKKHPQKKVLVFVSCCKEVKYFHEILVKNDVRALALHGGLSQPRRTEAYQSFHRKEHVVLIATDIASRGLDFPKVDWVVQLDCPDDVNQYIHRSGRTARYDKTGHAVLVLLPEEEEHFLPKLIVKKIPIEKMEIPVKVLQSIPMKISLGNILARDPELKASAQRCFKSYLMHLWKSGRKKEMMSIDLPAFARSLGLHDPPRVRFLERQQRRDAVSTVGTAAKKSKQATVAPQTFSNAQSDDSDDEVLLPKKVNSNTGPPEEEDLSKLEPVNNKLRHISKSTLAKKLAHKGILANTRIKFDDEGNAVEVDGSLVVPIEDRSTGLNLDEAKERLLLADVEDRLLQRKRIREKHRLENKKKKELRRKPGQPLAREDMPEDDVEGGVTLAGFDDAEFEGGVTLGSFEDQDGAPSQMETQLSALKTGKEKKKRKIEKVGEVTEEGLEVENRKKRREKPTKKGKKKTLSVGSSKLQTKNVPISAVQADEDLALRLLLT